MRTHPDRSFVPETPVTWIAVLFFAAPLIGCQNESAEGETFPPATSNAAASDVNRLVHSAGVRDAAAFMRKIPRDRLADYGFKTVSELDEVTVEQPIQVYAVSPIENDTRQISAFQPTSEWRLPLSVDGEWRVLLTVSKQGRTFRAVSLGAAPLAVELQEKRRSVPKGATKQYLLRVHKTRQDWLGYDVPSHESEYLPLMEDRRQSPTAPSPIRRSLLIDKINHFGEVRD